MTTNLARMTHMAKTTNKKARGGKNLPKSPNWGSLLFGILIGVFATGLIVFMFSTSDITLKIPTGKTKNKSDPGTIVQNTPQPDPVVAQEPRFDFYTELTKNTPDPSPLQPVKEDSDLKSTPKAINGYLVQAGPFKRNADADAIKATLTLNGFAAKVEPIKLRDGEVRHRVMLGPYPTEKNAQLLQQKLKSLEIDSVLVQKYAD